MRAVSALGNTVDSLRVAVLAALNIADELCAAPSPPRASRQPRRQPAKLAALQSAPAPPPSPTCSTKSSKTAKSASDPASGNLAKSVIFS